MLKTPLQGFAESGVVGLPAVGDAGRAHAWTVRLGTPCVVAEELELLEAGDRSWRSDAADRLRALLERPTSLDQRDGELLAVVALELSGEEDQTAIKQGRVTWRSLAADECADVANALRAAA